MTTPEPLPTAGADDSAAHLPFDAERRLHPWSWMFVMVDGVRQFVLPLAVLVFFGGRSEDKYQLYGAGAVMVALALVSVWRYFTYRYRIDGDSLRIRSGLLERESRQIPFSRIHDVSLQQNLLHRLFGVAAVKLESAGGNKPEAEMKVLAYADALALERLIRHRVPVDPDLATARAHDPDAEVSGQTLLALPTGEIVRLGLISNRGMVVVAGAFALAWQVFPDGYIVDLVRDAWHGASGYVVPGQRNAAGLGIAALALIALALALVRALSVLLAVVRYHGFRLSEHGRRLTVERGLFTRVRASVPRRRIQAWTLRETVLHRLFRRRTLHVDTAASQTDAHQPKPLHDLAPVATPAACDALVQRILPDVSWPPSAWSPLHPRAWLRLLLMDALFGVVVVAAATWFLGAWGLLALLWLPWAWLVARRHAARAGYAIDAQVIAVREGWWSRHWRFAELDKIQSLQLRRSPLDRRTGMASVWLDTAGAGALSPALRIRHLALADARALFARIEREVARRPLRW